jgi:hypothetical protein
VSAGDFTPDRDAYIARLCEEWMESRGDDECRCALIRIAYDMGHTAGLAAVIQEQEAS